MIQRNHAIERQALHRLHELGFHRPWYFDAKEGTLAIAVERFPAAVRNLVEEGWHVEAEGRVFRGAKLLNMQVTSGVDWFELHGEVDFGDGRSVKIAGAGGTPPRRGDGHPGRRDPRHRAGGMAAPIREDRRLWRAAGRPRPLSSADSASTRCWRRNHRFGSTRCSRARGRSLRRSPASRRSTRRRGFHGRLREYQREALGWFDFCAASVLAAALPMTWALARPSWSWRCSNHAGTTGYPDIRTPPGGRAAIARVQLD